MATQKPYSRTVVDMGSGCAGVSLPKGVRERYGIEVGDELPIELRDGKISVILDEQ